jgi:hypothetical protein
MKRNLSKIIIVVLLIASGMAIGLGYGHFRLRKERAVFAEKSEKMESRDELLKRKYMEQKALAGQLTSSKTMIEGQQRAFEEEVEKLRKEKAVVLREGQALAEKLKNEVVLLEQKYKTLEEGELSLKSEIQKNEEKYRREIQADKLIIKDKEAETRKIASEKKDLQQELKRISQVLERCEANNARLCIIAGELVEKYRNKGVTKSILLSEPFTQLQKVEMEKLIQEYMERIEKEQVYKKNGMVTFKKYLSQP